MSDDLIERLRASAALPTGLYAEAANELEAARKRIAQLEESLHLANGVADLALQHRDAAEAALEALVKRCKTEFVLAADNSVIAAEAALERLYQDRKAYNVGVQPLP